MINSRTANVQTCIQIKRSFTPTSFHVHVYPSSGYSGHCFMNACTSFLTAVMVASLSVSINTLSIMLTTVTTCASFIPWCVMAGTPTLIPLVTNGLLSSNGTAFLLSVMCALSSVSCAFFTGEVFCFAGLSASGGCRYHC